MCGREKRVTLILSGEQEAGRPQPTAELYQGDWPLTVIRSYPQLAQVITNYLCTLLPLKHI